MIGKMRALEKRISVEFAICVNNCDYPASLELRGLYRVLPDEYAEAHNEVRIIDESGEDYLYPAEYFAPIGPPKPREVGNVRALLEEIAVAS